MTPKELKKLDLKNPRVKKLKKGIIKLVKEASINDLVELFIIVETLNEKHIKAEELKEYLK